MQCQGQELKQAWYRDIYTAWWNVGLQLFIKEHQMYGEVSMRYWFQNFSVGMYFNNYNVISQLRHSYAKGPFCMTQIKYILNPLNKATDK